MTLNLIAAVAENLAIGFQNKLIYWLPDDLRRFKALTTGHTVIMGRKTFESLPGGKPLPDRINIVLTTDVEYAIEPNDNVFITHSVQDTVDLCEALFPDKEWFVIGGESIYKQFMENGLVSEMRLTLVNDNADGDTFFPEFSEDDWYTYYKSMAMVGKREYVETSFYFQILKKKNSQ
jgi:dihydrofolate reductase